MILLTFTPNISNNLTTGKFFGCRRFQAHLLEANSSPATMNHQNNLFAGFRCQDTMSLINLQLKTKTRTNMKHFDWPNLVLFCYCECNSSQKVSVLRFGKQSGFFSHTSLPPPPNNSTQGELLSFLSAI